MYGKLLYIYDENIGIIVRDIKYTFCTVKHAAAILVKKNYLLTTLAKLTKAYSIKFDLKPIGTVNGWWTNIIHFTTGENYVSFNPTLPK